MFLLLLHIIRKFFSMIKVVHFLLGQMDRTPNVLLGHRGWMVGKWPRADRYIVYSGVVWVLFIRSSLQTLCINFDSNCALISEWCCSGMPILQKTSSTSLMATVLAS